MRQAGSRQAWLAPVACRPPAQPPRRVPLLPSHLQDIHFTYAGYAPLSVRLVQQALSGEAQHWQGACQPASPRAASLYGAAAVYLSRRPRLPCRAVLPRNQACLPAPDRHAPSMACARAPAAFLALPQPRAGQGSSRCCSSFPANNLSWCRCVSCESGAGVGWCGCVVGECDGGGGGCKRQPAVLLAGWCCVAGGCTSAALPLHC